MHAVYLPDVEKVMGANHGLGHGTGSKKKERERRRDREHGSWINKEHPSRRLGG